jgi:ubiquinone/menaquinone biosynthesis C-methylase UbiE
MVHRFEDPAKWSPVFDSPDRDAWQKPQSLVRHLEIKKGMVVADVGAGTGYLMSHLARAVGPTGKVIAADIEPKMVEHLTLRAQKEKFPQITAQLAAPTDPKLSASSVDRIVFLDTWHHVPARVEYAKKLLSALRPGGAVYVVDFTMESSHGPPKHHRLLPEQVKQEFDQAGLLAEVISEDLPDQYIVVGRKKTP